MYENLIYLRRQNARVAISPPFRSLVFSVAACVLTLSQPVGSFGDEPEIGSNGGSAWTRWYPLPVWLGNRETAWGPQTDRLGQPLEKDFWLPVYENLASDRQFRQELKLTKAQDSALRKIGVKCEIEDRESLAEINGRSEPVQDWQEPPKLPAIYTTRQQRLVYETRSKVEGLLAPAQTAMCKQVAFANLIGDHLQDPDDCRNLALTPTQIASFASLDEDWCRMRFRADQRFGDRLSASFTERQMDKLRKLAEPRGRAGGDLTSDTRFELPGELWGRFAVVHSAYVTLSILRDELALTVEQEKKLRTISATKRHAEPARDVHDNVVSVLTDKQRRKLNEIEFRNSLVTFRFTGSAGTALSLSEKQIEEIKAIDVERQHTLWILNLETSEKLTALLTEQQRTKLNALLFKKRFPRLSPINSGSTSVLPKTPRSSIR